ncbi:MAG: YqcC family protein [Halioglobus sp.]
MQTTIAEVLIDIEAQLRQLGMWDKIPPSSQALLSTEPFCVDTLTLPQWLQFIFIPTLYSMLEEQQPLPDRCGIAPMADEFFRGTGLAIDELKVSLERMDELLSGEEEAAD